MKKKKILLSANTSIQKHSGATILPFIWQKKGITYTW